jgi:hypothetical protein
MREMRRLMPVEAKKAKRAKGAKRPGFLPLLPFLLFLLPSAPILESRACGKSVPTSGRRGERRLQLHMQENGVKRLTESETLIAAGAALE